MNNFDRFLKITKWAQRRYYGKEENRGLLQRGQALGSVSIRGVHV